MFSSNLNKWGLYHWLESCCHSIYKRSWLCSGMWQLWDQHLVILHRSVGQGPRSPHKAVGEGTCEDTMQLSVKWTSLYITQTQFSEVPCNQCSLVRQSPSKQKDSFSVGTAWPSCIPNLHRKPICWSNLSTRYPSLLLQQGFQHIAAFNRAIYPILTGKLEFFSG